MAHTILKILLIVALEQEANPIISKFGLQEDPSPASALPMKTYSGKYHQLTINLITQGRDPKLNVQNIGTQAATLATYVGISNFHPDLVINIGTAGGIAEHGAQIGDVYVSEKIYFFDRRMPMAGYEEYGLGGYESWKLGDAGLKKAVICSGDSFGLSDVDMEQVSKLGCAAKEMEAAGVAWVSMLMKTPMVAIKGISDIAGDKDAGEQFKKNLGMVTEKLAASLQVVLESLNSPLPASFSLGEGPGVRV